jgi:heptosyltransferase III
MRRLLIRPGAIGDFILSLPALECLREDYLEVWCAGVNVPLARLADRARSIASTGLDLLGVTAPPEALLETLRGFDSIVSWYGTGRPEFRAAVNSLALPITFFPALPGHEGGVHATEFYLAQAGTLSRRPVSPLPRIECSTVREDFAVIHPFSSAARKNWPLERFEELARKLAPTLTVQWCRGPEDPPLKGAVVIEDLYELACWLARASLYIGNDSGITHLAAAVGTPVLALFGPASNPAVWGPRGGNVRLGAWS